MKLIKGLQNLRDKIRASLYRLRINDLVVTQQTREKLQALVQSNNLTNENIDKVSIMVRAQQEEEMSTLTEKYKKARESSTWIIYPRPIAAREEYLKFSWEIEALKIIGAHISRRLSSLGRVKNMLCILAVSSVLSLVWVENNWGLDFIGGNYYLSFGIALASIFLIDSIVILIISALLSTVYSLMINNQLRALKIQHIVIAVLASFSVATFVVFVYSRMSTLSI